MVLLRGDHWALSLEGWARWRVMRQPPDAVPRVGWWTGPASDAPWRLYGLYLFPFALRWVRRVRPEA